VMSSDLSHFYPDHIAQEMDGVFINRLQKMDPWQLYESIKEKTCEACGAGPVVAGLIAAQQFKSPGCRLLSRANSGDVTGDRDRVVGYACAVIFDGDRDNATLETEFTSDMAIGYADQTFLLEHARRSIASAIGAHAGPESDYRSPALDEKRGAFVTLLVRNRLRGCVGTTEPSKSIRDMTADMAVAAATGDPRFPSLGIEDLDETHIEISILSPLESVTDVDSIDVGRHGLVLRNGTQGGLLLPQVATERGWGAKRFLEATCEKSGLPTDAWQDPGTEILVFTAIVFGEEKERTR